ELTAHIDEEPAERIGEPELARGTEPELPVDELVVDREVVAPVPRLGALPRQRREPRREVLGRALLAELRAFEQPRHDREELAWARRLDQVIVDLTADRLDHRAVLVRLRHHDDADDDALAAAPGQDA